MKPSIQKAKDVVNKKTSNYYKPTPKKWRKIGDALQDISVIGSAIIVIAVSPPAWIPVAIMVIGRFGKIITNFTTE